jgi:hypothetical protein
MSLRNRYYRFRSRHTKYWVTEQVRKRNSDMSIRLKGASTFADTQGDKQ